MPIKYRLVDNRLTPDPDDRYAQVTATRRAGVDEVADRIARAGSTVTRVDAVSVLESLERTIEELLQEGATVTLPFANFRVGIQGVFASDDAPFDPAQHVVLPRVQPGAALRRAFRAGVPVERLAPTRPAPTVLHFHDLNSDERDGPLTPGGMAELAGSHLAFEAAEPEQGAFFVAEAGGAATRVEVVGQNTPRRLLILVPTLAPGDYHVEVRAAFGSEVRTGRLDAVLTVA